MPTPRAASTKADYKAIAAKKIVDPGGGYRRWLVYGRYKMGKTRFASTAPNVLILDPENGTKEVPPGQAKIWPISQWSDYDEVFNAVRTGELVNPDTKAPFEWLCVDNMSRAGNMALRRVMSLAEERDLDRIPGQVQKQDYGKAGELIKGLLFNFHTLPLNILYTAGDRMDTGAGWGESEDEDAEQVEAKFVPDLPKGARASLNQIVDVIGRLYIVKVDHPKLPDKKLNQRRLWISPSDKYDTGYRSTHVLPDYLKGPTVSRLEMLITEGKV